MRYVGSSSASRERGTINCASISLATRYFALQDAGTCVEGREEGRGRGFLSVIAAISPFAAAHTSGLSGRGLMPAARSRTGVGLASAAISLLGEDGGVESPRPVAG